MADSRLDVLIQDLFAQKTEIGKEESYYGSAVELFVAITLSEGFNLITDQRIGSLVSCFLQMIRSESSEVCNLDNFCFKMECLFFFYFD